VLVERAEGIYSFSHLTLQEYLTAQYIDDHRQIETLVTEHLTDERWREVFLLVAGLMRGGADDLLLLMEKEAQKYINTPKLQALLRWAEQVTAGSESNLKPVAKRAIAIANANASSPTPYAIADADADAIIARQRLATPTPTPSPRQRHASPTPTPTPTPTPSTPTPTPRHRHAITYTRELEKLKVFKGINFTVLIARLEALKAKVPDDKQPKEVRRAFAKQFYKPCCKLSASVQNWLIYLRKKQKLGKITSTPIT
jgi:hypothetical protein